MAIATHCQCGRAIGTCADSPSALCQACTAAALRDQRIREAERRVIEAATAVTRAHDALNVATHRDTKRNLVAKRDRASLEMFAAVRSLEKLAVTP